jgi:hypothetical protein
MGVRRSVRSGDRVVYHCPACFADRVGLVGKGPYLVWPDDRPNRGTFFECTGCGNRVHPCNVKDSVTATAFSTQMFSGTTSLIACVVAAGAVDDHVIETAIDAVETVAPLRYPRERLLSDVASPELEVRMRGDLILLAERLQPHGVEALLAQARRVAAAGGATEDQLAIVARAQRYLGPPEPSRSRRRRRRILS